MRSILQALRDKLTGVADRVLLWWRRFGGGSEARSMRRHAPPDHRRTGEPSTPSADGAAGAARPSAGVPASNDQGSSAELSTQGLSADEAGELPSDSEAAVIGLVLTDDNAAQFPAPERGCQEEDEQARAKDNGYVSPGQPVLLDHRAVAAPRFEPAPEQTTGQPEAPPAVHATVPYNGQESPSTDLCEARSFAGDVNEAATGKAPILTLPADELPGRHGQATEEELPPALIHDELPQVRVATEEQQRIDLATGALSRAENLTRPPESLAAAVDKSTIVVSTSPAPAPAAGERSTLAPSPLPANHLASRPATTVQEPWRMDEPACGHEGRAGREIETNEGSDADLVDKGQGVAAAKDALGSVVTGAHARARDAHAERPIIISAPPLDEPAYLLWNRAIAQHCLLEEEGQEDVFLTITPTILAAAFGGVRSGRQLPEEAEACFVEAVAEVYRGLVLGHRRRLGVLRRCGTDGLPDCVAFLAASVLAAYRMQTDEEAAATAYYMRLAEILKCDLVGGHPLGFDPEEFEALWWFLERWLREEKGRRLAMPGLDVGVRRFVALPLTHVPLRRVDIERLSGFFTWAGYDPGARIPRRKLDQDLSSWSLGRSVFTNAGMAALADDRRTAVLAQIAHELESWDGSYTDSLGRRIARVEILLDPVQRRPDFFYMPRRPPAFPASFDDGVHAFAASDDGWYDPVHLLPEDGPELAEGFTWEIESGRRQFALHRPGASAIALQESREGYTGYLSHRALQLGVRGSVLCREALAEAAAQYLGAVSQGRCVPFNHPRVPDGWRLFLGIKPERRLDALPAGLEALAVESVVDLIPTGGLRLGSRWAWVAGASPRLIVAGLLPGDRVTIDGESVSVSNDGVVAAEDRLALPGTHVVEATGLRRRIEIVEPEVRNASRPLGPAGTAVALPPGHWMLVGAIPGEVAYPLCTSRGGAVASCSFTAVWAIDVGAGPGAKVLHLVANVSLPGRPERFSPYGHIGRSLRTWASTIYDAAIRRPGLMLLNGDEAGVRVKEAWAAYARVAREIKRRFRWARR